MSLFQTADVLMHSPTSNNAYTPVLEAIAQHVGLPSVGAPAPTDWREWLRVLFPAYFPAPFADRHAEMWQWVTALQPNVKPPPFVAIWGRGGAKSTNAEAAAVYAGAKGLRRYVWYVSETQDQADEHVANIADMLESPAVERHYPALARRKVGKYGASKGWRRNRLRTESGLTVDALGLDTARRGFKVEEQRPDLMIFDDIDGGLDTAETTAKKERIITRSLLPAGSSDCAILAIQNLVIPSGIFARLNDGRAAYLANRTISGPHPAVIDLQTENSGGRDIITSGTATWAGQDLDTCQAQIDEWGLIAFLAEAQHEVYLRDGQIFLPEWWAGTRNRYRLADADDPPGDILARYIFWDTALKDKAASDPSAYMVFELIHGYMVRVRDWAQMRIDSAYLPGEMQRVAYRWNKDGKLQAVVVEDKGSGTTSISTLRASAVPWLAEKIFAFQPMGSKVYRAKNAAVWGPRDSILFPYPTAEIEDYHALLDEETGQLFRFPNVPHDDMVDAYTMGVLYLEHYISQGWHGRMGHLQKEKKPHDSRVQRALRGMKQ